MEHETAGPATPLLRRLANVLSAMFRAHARSQRAISFDYSRSTVRQTRSGLFVDGSGFLYGRTTVDTPRKDQAS